MSVISFFVQGTVLKRLHGCNHYDVAVYDGLLYAMAIDDSDDDDSDDDGASVIHVYSIQTWQPTSVIYIPCAGRWHWHTLCINAKCIFISCGLQESVIKMSLHGKQFAIYGGQHGKGLDEFDYPIACMSDSDGNMLIADGYKDRLQLLHGNQWSVLHLHPSPHQPCGAVCDGSALFVSTWDPHAIAKYEEIK